MDLVVVGAWGVVAVCAVLVVWAGIRAARQSAVVLKQLLVGAAAEALLLVQAVAAGVAVAGGRVIVEAPVFWGYLVVALLLLPAGAVVAIAERTRWSSVVLIVIAVALAVMEYRVLTLWWMGSGAG